MILTESIAFVGLSRRTNEDGLKQISAILSAMDFEVRSIEVPEPFLHLGGAMSILSPDDVLCCQKKGYMVHSLDLSEFIKGTGGPSCLIMPV